MYDIEYHKTKIERLKGYHFNILLNKDLEKDHIYIDVVRDANAEIVRHYVIQGVKLATSARLVAVKLFKADKPSGNYDIEGNLILRGVI